MADVRSLWDKTLSVLKDELTEVGFKTWFATIEPLAMEGNELILSAPNEIHKNTILNKYKTLLVNALNVVSDMPLTFSVVLSGEYEAKEVPSARPFPEGSLNPRYTFDEFVVGKNNEYAHAACLAVAENPARAYNPLFLYGGAGLGKTHLIQSVGHYILEQDPHAKVLYVTSEKFTNDLINSIKEDKNEEFRNLYRSLDVLLIDDIQFIAGKERTQEEFFHTFLTLYEANRQIILTSDRPPTEIPLLSERLTSRFKCGLLTDIQPPDFETRMAILRKKAQDNKMELPDGIITFVAQSIKSNIRELEGALKRIYLYRTLSDKPLTEEFAEEALRDFFSRAEEIVMSNDLVLNEVSRYFNISKEELLSKKRTKECAYIRQIAMYLCRELVGSSLSEVGKFFGKRDHSTVLYACDKIEKEIEQDIELKNTITDLTKNIKHSG